MSHQTISLDIKFDLDGINKQLDGIKDILENRMAEAVQAGAQVYYERMKVNATSVEGKSGKGLLARSIYQYRDIREQRPGHATYKISWRKGSGPKDENGKRVASGLPVAFHGIFLEYGWTQRYNTYLGKDGVWHTAVRPEKYGTAPPKGKGVSQAARDAYYVLSKTPVHHAPKSFLRKTYFEVKDKALAAVETKLQDMMARSLL